MSYLAGAEGLEPSRTVLETAMLPLHHAPIHKRLEQASFDIIAPLSGICQSRISYAIIPI